MALWSYPALERTELAEREAKKEAETAELERAEYWDERDEESEAEADDALLDCVRKTDRVSAGTKVRERGGERHTAADVYESNELDARAETDVAEAYALSPANDADVEIWALRKRGNVSPFISRGKLGVLTERSPEPKAPKQQSRKRAPTRSTPTSRRQSTRTTGTRSRRHRGTKPTCWPRRCTSPSCLNGERRVRTLWHSELGGWGRGLTWWRRRWRRCWRTKPRRLLHLRPIAAPHGRELGGRKESEIRGGGAHVDLGRKKTGGPQARLGALGRDARS